MNGFDFILFVLGFIILMELILLVGYIILTLRCEYQDELIDDLRKHPHIIEKGGNSNDKQSNCLHELQRK